MSQKTSGVGFNWKLALVLFIAVVVKDYYFMKASEFYGGDEFFIISRGLWMAKGYVPYRDFWYPHFLGMVYLMTPVHVFLSGYNALYATRIMSALNYLVVVFLIFKLGEKFYDADTGFVASVFFVFNQVALRATSTTMYEPYMVSFTLASLYFVYVRKNIVVSAFLLAFAVSIKYWVVVFISLPYLLMFVKREIGFRYVGWCLLFTVILLSPTLLMYGEFTENSNIYLAMHNVKNRYLQKFNLSNGQKIAGTLLYFVPITFMIIFTTIEFLYAFVKRKKTWSVNVFHMWFASTVGFMFFPRFYTTHHPLLIVPPACIIFACPIARYLRRFQKPTLVVVVVALAVYFGIFFKPNMLEKFGDYSFRADKIDVVVDYLKSHCTDDTLILQDYGMYSYLADVGDATMSGWGFSYGIFDHRGIRRIVEKTRPKYVVMTLNAKYPRRGKLYIVRNFKREEVGGVGFPRVYYTGYESSNPQMGIYVLSTRKQIANEKLLGNFSLY